MRSNNIVLQQDARANVQTNDNKYSSFSRSLAARIDSFERVPGGGKHILINRSMFLCEKIVGLCERSQTGVL